MPTKSRTVVGIIVMQKELNGKLSKAGFDIIDYKGEHLSKDIKTPSGDVIEITIR